MLCDNGMFPDQAKKVMEVAKPELEIDGYRVTWDRPAEEYPEPFYKVGYLIVRRVAGEWLKENLPKAWFRPMFDDEYAKKIGLVK